MKNLLKNKLYITSLFTDMLSNFGDVLFYLALMNYVLILPDPKYAISIITLSETLPSLAGFILGHVADKTTNRVRQIIGTLFFRAILYVFVGILMGFEPALWVVIFVAFVNFFSDIAGQYESGLFVPLTLKIVPDELREQSVAFRQTIRQILDVVFRSISAVLVTIMTYQTLAYVNALTFFICAMIMILIARPLNNLIKDDELKQQEIKKEQKKEKFTKDFIKNTKFVFAELRKVPDLFAVFMVAPLLNGVYVVVSPLVILLISEDSNFVIMNAQTTIAIIPIILTIFGIIGSILSVNVFKNTGMIPILKSMSVLGIGVFIGLLIHNIYVFLLFLAISVLVSTALQPKLSANLMRKMPKQSLATISGFIGTYVQVGMIIMSVLFSWVVTFLSSKMILIIMLIMMMSITIFVYIYTRGFKNEIK